MKKPSDGAAESGRHLKWGAVSRLKLFTQLQANAGGMGGGSGPAVGTSHAVSWIERERQHKIICFPFINTCSSDQSASLRQAWQLFLEGYKKGQYL